MMGLVVARIVATGILIMEDNALGDSRFEGIAITPLK